MTEPRGGFSPLGGPRIRLEGSRGRSRNIRDSSFCLLCKEIPHWTSITAVQLQYGSEIALEEGVDGRASMRGLGFTQTGYPYLR